MALIAKASTMTNNIPLTFYRHITLNILHLCNKYLIRTITFNFMGLNFMMKTYIQIKGLNFAKLSKYWSAIANSWSQYGNNFSNFFHNNSCYWQQWSKPLSIVDRLPREIIKAASYALFSFDRRGHLDQRSHFQEGLETPVKAVIEMKATTRNRETKKPLTAWTRSMDTNGLFDNCTKDLN